MFCALMARWSREFALKCKEMSLGLLNRVIIRLTFFFLFFLAFFLEFSRRKGTNETSKCRKVQGLKGKFNGIDDICFAH